MGRFVVIVLDGFGVGAMSDTSILRKEDGTANTAKSILQVYPQTKWKQLSQLGLMNILGFETANMKFAKQANYGKCNLMHVGADTFLGHQEIMGTKPKKPVNQCFQDVKGLVRKALVQGGYHVRTIQEDGLEYYVVNECVSVADNIDSDLGQAINCIAALDRISFEELLQIGQVVRGVVTCNRVIAFGGNKVSIDQILAAQEVKEHRYIGNIAVKTGVYEEGYEVRHLGYGVNELVQAPYLLGKEGIPVTLIGKVADVCHNHFGKSISCVDSARVMDLVIEELQEMKEGFICANIQETDLAGHSMNTEWYHKVLSIVDQKLEEVLPLIHGDDILLICADHGNDPEIGHNHHTREQVPIMVYTQGYFSQGNISQGNRASSEQENRECYLGERSTLSDIGATVCAYFHVNPCENGVPIGNIL